MFEVILGVLLGILCVGNLALWFKLSSCYDALTTVIQKSDDFKMNMPSIEDLNDEINATLTDFVNNLHIPTAADHLMGGVSNLLQMWGMKKFGGVSNMLQTVEDRVENNDY